MASIRRAAAAAARALGRPTWQQTMIRVKDPKISVPYYEKRFGMTLLNRYDFPSMKFSLYFLASLKKADARPPKIGTPESAKYLWSFPGTTVELTHNWGTEAKEGPVYHPGNAERDGFGHLAFECDDVYKACESLVKQGVKFKKLPDEGRMKGLAFAYDPDGYWVEIVKRDKPRAAEGYGDFTLAQTMLRVRDPKPSLRFYTEYMGMKVTREKHFPNDKGTGFSLYFLSTCPEGKDDPLPGTPVIELTHNHGTEKQDDFKHYNGNTEPRKGFGHVGFLVDDVFSKCEELKKAGVKLVKGPSDGTMLGLAFAEDPDGYWVEIVKRGGYAGGSPYYLKGEEPQ